MMHARKKSHRKRIILYAVYAWGTACLATIFAIFADSSKMPEHMKPGIGVESCFLKGERTKCTNNALMAKQAIDHC